MESHKAMFVFTNSNGVTNVEAVCYRWTGMRHGYGNT